MERKTDFPRWKVLGRWAAAACAVGVAGLYPPTPDRALEVAFVGLSEDEYLRELNECTTGLASGAVTPDGRPLLWKNRDVGNRYQEFHYYDDGRIPFISITYRGETDEYYGGVNAAGFALENSNSYNLPGGAYGNGWGYGDDDGFIHTLALATCRTVDDFQALLDSLNEGGRTLNCNYGAIDAFGGAAMFETAAFFYTRCDAEDSPDGFLIRSNYSYSGSGLNNRPQWWGAHRHDRAYQLFKAAAERNELTPKYIFQKVVRDLTIDGLDPYPLPFDGYYSNYPYGCIPNDEAICRSTTRGVLVVQGVRAGERPDDAVLWAMLGTQLATVPIPLWVRAGSVPPEADADTSRINRRGIELSQWIYNGNAVDTWKLTNPLGTGIWDYLYPLEDWVFAKVERFLRSPQFSYDRLEAFQNLIARQVADSLDAWHPTYSVTSVVEPVFENGNVVLAWGELGEESGGDRQVRGYQVFRSAEPFRRDVRGEALGIVQERRFVDRQPLASGGYYRVEMVY